VLLLLYTVVALYTVHHVCVSPSWLSARTAATLQFPESCVCLSVGAACRSLGDLDFKEPARFVECDPDVTRLALQPHKDRFVILGSDGLWDVLSDTDAVVTAAAALKVGTGHVCACGDQLNRKWVTGSIGSECSCQGGQVISCGAALALMSGFCWYGFDLLGILSCCYSP